MNQLKFVKNKNFLCFSSHTELNLAEAWIEVMKERMPRESIPLQFDEALITLPKETEGPGLKLLNTAAVKKLKDTHKGVKGLNLKNWPFSGRTVIEEKCEYYFNIKMLYAFLYNTHYLFYYCCYWLIWLGIFYWLRAVFTSAFESATGHFLIFSHDHLQPITI